MSELDRSGRPRDPSDAWVVAPDGARYWGLHGAAGLLLWHPLDGVLMQLRASWGHHGGTWGVPGGARREGESALDAAVRESNEEAGVPFDAVDARFEHVLDLGVWSYTTIVGIATRRLEARATDAESAAVRWVPVDEVGALELHPGFGAAWPTLREHVRALASDG